ncbi:MAG: nitroreductase family protein [bacterium]
MITDPVHPPAAAQTATGRAPNLEAALRNAASRAVLAPSIHNSQPWRFVVRPNALDIYADRSRTTPVIDPTRRQMAIGCGAALFGARAAIAADQLDAVTTLLPDPAQPDLLASITVIGPAPTLDRDAFRLDAVAESRHSNRRQFAAEPVPDDVLDVLSHAAQVEGAWLQPIRSEADRVAVAVISQHADALQNADPAYRSELRHWTTADADRADGVPAGAVPHVTGASHDDVPIRDFDTKGAGALPGDTQSSGNQTMVVLGTAGDGMRDWLIAGQALGRVLLELTDAGLVSSIMSQVVESPGTRQQLRSDLRLNGHPHLMLRIGTAAPTPPTPRRPMSEVLA